MSGLSWQQGVALGVLGIVLLLGILVGVLLLFRLFKSRSLIRREFTAYFTSPIAYVVIVPFLFFTARTFT